VVTFISIITPFVSVGCYAFVGGASRAQQDVAPYILADGTPARPRCINVVALKRNDFDPTIIETINEAYRLIYRSKVGLDNARELMTAKGSLTTEVEHFLQQIEQSRTGRHGRCRPQQRKAA